MINTSLNLCYLLDMLEEKRILLEVIMMRTERDDRLWAFWNSMRGAVESDDLITATVLIDEVRLVNGNSTDETPDQAYAALLEAADRIGVRNPFSDKDRFYYVYQESKKLEKLDWEGALLQEQKTSRKMVLPTVLVEEYISRIDSIPASVLISEAEKFVPNLTRIVDTYINSQVTLTTQSAVYANILKKIFREYDNVEVVEADIYQYEFMNRRFDLIFAFPAFGGRLLTEDRTFICRDYDMVAFENLSLHLNGGGRLIITLPGRITFAAGKVGDLRQFIQTNYTIREISDLPAGILEFTGIKVFLLDIENTRPGDDDIIIRRYSAGERKNRRSEVTNLKIEDDTFVMLSELEEQGDWSVERIFAQQDEEYLNYQKSSVRKDLIGNVAQIFRGKSVTKKDANGTIGVVNISNIGDYEIDYEGLDHIDEENRKISNYVLKEGDVLLPARGTAIRTAVFHEQKDICIASSNVIVIRPDARKLDSTYLKIFLDSPIGNKLISGAQQGVTIMNISYKDLNVLEIPLPALEEQKAAAHEYLEELQRYKDTMAAAERRWTETLAKLQKF